MAKRSDLNLVAQRGWERGEHAERDKERGRTLFDLDNTVVSLGDKSDDWMSELIQFPPSSPELSGTEMSANEPMPCTSLSLLPKSNVLDDCDGLLALEEKAEQHEARVSWKPEGGLIEVEVSPREAVKSEVDYIDITRNAEILPEAQQDCYPFDVLPSSPRAGRHAMAPAENLDLVTSARSSLSLMESCSSDTLSSGVLAGSPPVMASSFDEDQEVGILDRSNLDTRSTGQTALISPPPGRGSPATVAGIALTSSEPSPRSPSPPLATPPVSQTVSPCAASNTGSTKSGQVVTGGKRGRIKIITSSTCGSKKADDVESTPPRKKRRITLKMRSRVSSKNENAGDTEAVQATPRDEHRIKPTKVAKPISKRIILNKQTKGAEPMRADKQTQVVKPTKTRIILKTDSRALHKRSRIGRG